MECPNCQNEIPANAVFCGEYGHKLEQPARPSPSKPVSIQETTPPLQQYPVSSPALAKAHKGVPGWVWGLGGALGVVLTGVCAFISAIIARYTGCNTNECSRSRSHASPTTCIANR
jgi:hypothetical protein